MKLRTVTIFIAIGIISAMVQQNDDDAIAAESAINNCIQKHEAAIFIEKSHNSLKTQNHDEINIVMSYRNINGRENEWILKEVLKEFYYTRVDMRNNFSDRFKCERSL